jgi:hypothetical protein
VVENFVLTQGKLKGMVGFQLKKEIIQVTVLNKMVLGIIAHTLQGSKVGTERSQQIIVVIDKR